MPSDMFLRGKHDAEADALDESFYQYYYDYRLAYDEAVRLRRRGERRALLSRVGRVARWVLPVLILVAVVGWWTATMTRGRPASLMGLINRTPTASATRTPRPTLPPPTTVPSSTPTEIPALRPNASAIITGTDNAPLRIHTTPGKDTPAPGRFDPGKHVQILEGPQRADGIDWWRVQSGDSQGWVAGPFLAPLSEK